MTINLKNFLNDKNKMSKMGEFQNLKQIEGLEMSSVSADLYGNGRDDLTFFYLLNDDTNSFEYVITSLTTFLPMCNVLRAEQIAMIIHNSGECNVYSGFAPEIYILYTHFQKAGLNAQIREYNKN